jgi:hypothetical protein
MRAQDRDPCTVPGLILVGEDQGRFFPLFSLFFPLFFFLDGAGLGRSVTSRLAMTPAALTNQALTRERREAGAWRLVIISRLTSGVTTMSRLLGRATVRLGRLRPF